MFSFRGTARPVQRAAGGWNLSSRKAFDDAGSSGVEFPFLFVSKSMRLERARQKCERLERELRKCPDFQLY
jgi:hypothetical protein